MIAKAMIRDTHKPLKQFAIEFGCSYATVYKVLREYINVTRVLTLRYPDE